MGNITTTLIHWFFPPYVDPNPPAPPTPTFHEPTIGLLNLPPTKITTSTAAGETNLVYYYKAPSDPSKPVAFLLHGFPDNVTSFNSCASALLANGYGVLGLDPIGYGLSDQPIAKCLHDKAVLDKFAGKNQADMYLQIMDQEGLEKVVVIGHDWGSLMAGKLGMWYPERVHAIILGNIAYFPPADFDLDSYLKKAKELTGIENSGYMKFLSTGPVAAEVIRAHPESFASILYAADPNAWRDHMVPVGRLESFLRSNKVVPTLPTIPQSVLDELYAHIKQDGLASALGSYMAMVGNYHWENGEKDLSKLRYMLQPPTLMIATRRDWSSPWMYVQSMRLTVRHLTIKEVDSGHWTMHEKESEWNQLVLEFLGKQSF